jgi:hypothetical protein
MNANLDIRLQRLEELEYASRNNTYREDIEEIWMAVRALNKRSRAREAVEKNALSVDLLRAEVRIMQITRREAEKHMKKTAKSNATFQKTIKNAYENGDKEILEKVDKSFRAWEAQYHRKNVERLQVLETDVDNRAFVATKLTTEMARAEIERVQTQLLSLLRRVSTHIRDYNATSSAFEVSIEALKAQLAQISPFPPRCEATHETPSAPCKVQP